MADHCEFLIVQIDELGVDYVFFCCILHHILTLDRGRIQGVTEDNNYHDEIE